MSWQRTETIQPGVKPFDTKLTYQRLLTNLSWQSKFTHGLHHAAAELLICSVERCHDLIFCVIRLLCHITGLSELWQLSGSCHLRHKGHLDNGADHICPGSPSNTHWPRVPVGYTQVLWPSVTRPPPGSMVLAVSHQAGISHCGHVSPPVCLQYQNWQTSY